MMRSSKQYLMIICLFIVLAAIVFLPIPLLNSQNNLLLDHPYTYTENAILQKDSISADAYSALDRLSVLSEDNIVIHSSRYNDPQIHNELKSQLLPILEEHILYLQEHNALPQFMLFGALNTEITQKTYMSADDPSLSLSVWEMYVEYDYFTVTAYIDTSSYALYDISLNSNFNFFYTYKQNLSANSFAVYFTELCGLSQTDIYCKGIYSPTVISLYLTENGKDYHFNKNSIYNDEATSSTIMQK